MNYKHKESSIEKKDCSGVSLGNCKTKTSKNISGISQQSDLPQNYKNLCSSSTFSSLWEARARIYGFIYILWNKLNFTIVQYALDYGFVEENRMEGMILFAREFNTNSDYPLCSFAIFMHHVQEACNDSIRTLSFHNIKFN